MKALRWVLGGLFVLVLGLGAAFWTYRHAVLPVTEGTLSLAGLQGQVRIERDAAGIPTVRADSQEDLAFGLGFVHAQDRLWQLETHRRIAAGRLAEAFGPGALDSDRFLRALGARRAAAAQWAKAQGETRSLLLAYARGVNAAIARLGPALPPEFLILGVKPEAWDPVDSLGWGVMMAWDLSGNWTTELLRMRLAQKLPVQRIDELLPPYPGEKPLPVADYAALYRTLALDARLADRTLAVAPPSGIEGAGSNNWVVSGARSESGKPLLANDPHLHLSAPALWYFARLEAPGFKAAGATLPGLPVVVLGQNQHIAWGYTNTGPDVQDLYLERIQPGQPSRYQTPEGWADFQVTDEVIKVKGGPDVRFAARSTRHGPVISDAGVADDLLGAKGQPSYAIAMRWTALDPDADFLAAQLALSRAGSVDDFVAASAQWVVPMQNMVVADDAGHIGFVAAGRVPLRKPENDLRGLVPAPGWDARYDWDGWVPAQETPREVDPGRGWIATANHRIHGPDYPYFLGSEWAPPWRYERIAQLLQARAKHSTESFAAIQSDVVSLAAVPLLPWLQNAKSPHPLAGAAHLHLKGFDGTMAADRAAPLIFNAWVRHLVERVVGSKVDREFYQRVLAGRSFRDALQNVMERNDAWWCDDPATPGRETCETQADLAFTDALVELQASHGDEVASWQWGEAHQARSEHRPFSKVPALSRFFELRAPVGGDTWTVNVSRVGLKPDPTTGELYLDEHGPSLRAIYDLADPANSRFMHSTGQSGVPLSPHYRDFVEPWARVDYVPVWAQGAPRHVLVLEPGGRGADRTAP